MFGERHPYYFDLTEKIICLGLVIANCRNKSGVTYPAYVIIVENRRELYETRLRPHTLVYLIHVRRTLVIGSQSCQPLRETEHRS